MFRDLFDEEQLRIRILFAGMMAAFLILLAWLWRMQVAHVVHYQEDLLKQSVRRVRLPGMRGRILDRNGQCLADNRPSYCIAVYLEELRQPGRWPKTIDRVNRALDELSAVLQRPREVTTEDIKMHTVKRLPLPLIAWRDVDEVALARLAERAPNLGGVDIQVEAVRQYPLSNRACHVIGYVGRAEPPKDESEPFHYYIPEMAGRSGVERVFDGVLRGEAGGRLVRVDVSGFRHDDLAVREPSRGLDVVLSIDAEAQRLVEEALSDVAGAGVIIDPENGDVLAMASTPGFDLNEFAPAISPDEWKVLNEDPRKPMVNRAVSGVYAPGSTFKPVVAFAALENRKASASTSFDCPGYFSLGRARFSCWYTPGHGLLNMREGLQHSCNVYFFHTGLLAGPDAIANMAGALGLGRKTDIALDAEVAGLVPDPAWKRRTYSDAWRDGDTCNFSIGQGALGVTPLQMALLTSAIANEGTLYRPRLVTAIQDASGAVIRAFPPHAANRLNWSPANTRVVREGMRDVVMAPRGTGKFAAIPGVVMAGKTGTAEYGRKGSGLKHGWMIAFAPYDKPRYAVALVIEEAVTGGTTTAPRMRRVMYGLFNRDESGGGQG